MKNDNTETRDENGFLHSYDDKPAVIEYHGSLYWYQHGKQHRDNGPAVIYSNGDKLWYQHGKQHREDGPAVITSYGNSFFYYMDECLAFHEWIKLSSLSEEEKTELLLSN